jgi:hypothetical protein
VEAYLKPWEGRFPERRESFHGGYGRRFLRRTFWQILLPQLLPAKRIKAAVSNSHLVSAVTVFENIRFANALITFCKLTPLPELTNKLYLWFCAKSSKLFL